MKLAMIDPDDTGDMATDVARRLRRTRAVLGLDQTTFATAAGLSQPRYAAYEAGAARALTLKAALLLCERYGLTLDWLYRGDPSGLPYRMHDALRTTRNGN